MTEKTTSKRSFGRVLRIDVDDPNGESIRHYRDFVRLTGPSGESAIPFAWNDLPGRWTITVTDVATGVATAKTVLLRHS